MKTFKIRDAEKLCKDHDLQAVVVLTVERTGTIRITTYGETKKKCKVIGEWGQGLWEYAVTKIPFQTVFGWGNRGQPKTITPEELETVSKNKNIPQDWYDVF